MEKKKVKVTIAGATYSLLTDETAAYNSQRILMKKSKRFNLPIRSLPQTRRQSLWRLSLPTK